MTTYYETQFVPNDRNLTPADCLDIRAYASKVDAIAAAARDAMHAADEWQDRASQNANMIAAKNLIAAAINETANPVNGQLHVSVDVHGSEPYTIGYYLIRSLYIGDMRNCDTCDDHRGTIDTVDADGTIHASCESCQPEHCHDCSGRGTVPIGGDGTTPATTRGTYAPCPSCIHH